MTMILIFISKIVDFKLLLTLQIPCSPRLRLNSKKFLCRKAMTVQEFSYVVVPKLFLVCAIGKRTLLIEYFQQMRNDMGGKQ